MEAKHLLNNDRKIWLISGWLFGLIVLAVGILNMLLVHPVPGIAYLFLSLLYFPPANDFLRKRFRISIPLIVKFMLGVALFLFTLGVSDLGDMIDKL
ncbi:hypothetical protein [Pontibacter akesuensis]|uniref:Uncharacterized protein n=1 Tax=Pontibacter akesuensis TaxID=388950 RepID=A0A1I7GL30_9BACT|nr:hypothetical protein [Pontibacter akesuensis]SFU48966.1 hypothetical protein SAMN04487941_1091 [Pontibacter akesuensis]